MQQPTQDVFINFQTSFAIDDAVAILLGWMQGPLTQKNILADFGITEDQLPDSPGFSLEIFFNLLLQATESTLNDARQNNAPAEVIKEKEDAVKRCKEYSHKAQQYFLDIHEELSKGDESEIRIDQLQTERTDCPHVTLKSLDRWARKRYGISLVDSSYQTSISNNDAKEQESVEENESNLERGLSRTKAENLFTTLALLVEAFSEKASGFRVKDKPNVSQISKHLEELATDNTTKECLKGQNRESIKKRITEALDVKRSKLPEK